jgi:hypothetical protein
MNALQWHLEQSSRMAAYVRLFEAKALRYGIDVSDSANAIGFAHMISSEAMLWHAAQAEWIELTAAKFDAANDAFGDDSTHESD